MKIVANPFPIQSKNPVVCNEEQLLKILELERFEKDNALIIEVRNLADFEPQTLSKIITLADHHGAQVNLLLRSGDRFLKNLAAALWATGEAARVM